MYGLFDGWMYPLACCSWTNLSSAFCSSCVSWYTFPSIDDGAPGFNSIAWSQICSSGNLWDASLNTERWQWYLVGILLSPICNPACSASLEANVCFLLVVTGIDTRATCIALVIGGIHQGGFLLPVGVTTHFPICDPMAFQVCSISGSWVLLIHPLA